MKYSALLVASLACACHAPGSNRAVSTNIRDCEYWLTLGAEGRARVEAVCDADGPMTFALSAPYLRRSVKSDTVPKAGHYHAPQGRLSYEVDLKRLARANDDFDRAKRVGASFVGTLSSVLMVPEPLTTDIVVQLHVRSEPNVKVAVGLRRTTDAGGYVLMAHEIPVATYFAFGKLEQRTLELAGGKLELTRLDGPLAPSFDDLSRWVDISARAVSDFYGAFPVKRASVTLIPARARDAVVFGKVLPESAPGIAVLVGEHAPLKALYSDWILVHELFHLGFPSLNAQGKWLDEGLATYYEPVIRVRAGLYTEAELWGELEQRMPEGLPAFTGRGLAYANDFRGIYWGGAIACLVADVEARRHSPERGLEVGLRALRLAGGTASEVWSLTEAVEVIDRALGAPILGRVERDHSPHGTPFDLQALFRELGVERDRNGTIHLSDSAPLSDVRRAITRRRASSSEPRNADGAVGRADASVQNLPHALE